MFEVNGTLFIFLVMYVLFIIALNEVMMKPIGKVMAERAKLIQDDVDASKKHHVEAQEVVAAYQRTVSEAKNEAQNVINEAMTQAQKKRDEAVEKLAEQNRVKLGEAKKQLQGEREAAMGGLVEQEISLVKQMVEKLLGESVALPLDANTVRRALEEA